MEGGERYWNKGEIEKEERRGEREKGCRGWS